MLNFILLIGALLYHAQAEGNHQVDLLAQTHQMSLKFHQEIPWEQEQILGPLWTQIELIPWVDLMELSLSPESHRKQLYLRLAKVNVDLIPLDSLSSWCEQIESLESVEYCNLTPLYEIETPPSPPSLEMVEPPSSTPDFSDLQGYFKDTLNGINAEYAWNLGLTGEGVVFRDVEGAWDVDHEDLDNIVEVIPQTSEDWIDHGTNTIGVLMAQHNGFGINGATPDATMYTYSVENNTHQKRVDGVTRMVLDAQMGDILLIEMQDRGCQNATFPDYGPADYRMEIWDQINAASQDSVITIAASGNGNQNLDSSCYGPYRARGDNGSILVGSSHPDSLSKTSSSGYGQMVRLQGWGYSITTTGGTRIQDYVLQAGRGRDYQSQYSGTSGATPIVAAAAGLVQAWAIQNQNRYLGPFEMRELLVATGKPQSGEKHIGPLPDVRAAIEELKNSGQTTHLSQTEATSQTFELKEGELSVFERSKVQVFRADGSLVSSYPELAPGQRVSLEGNTWVEIQNSQGAWTVRNPLK